MSAPNYCGNPHCAGPGGNGSVCGLCFNKPRKEPAMTPKIKDLLDTMRSSLECRTMLHAQLDELLPPAATGYLRREQSWTIRWVRAGESAVDLELALEPPEGAVEWRFATVERLAELQSRLGCHRVHASVVGGVIFYTATWMKDEAATADNDVVTLARFVASHTKHGPGGHGDSGPCDAGCVKCRAELEIWKAAQK